MDLVQSTSNVLIVLNTLEIPLVSHAGSYLDNPHVEDVVVVKYLLLKVFVLTHVVRMKLKITKVFVCPVQPTVVLENVNITHPS